ncbi:hypothetical protein B0T09DRAFT_334268 [Sordaria sp. MPI-SDFR-AT-0083]|nr:hypothetical protein B0T09DRAFT_334268 [Sordaria sp. MPI-SDFR-AT-0083]
MAQFMFGITQTLQRRYGWLFLCLLFLFFLQVGSLLFSLVCFHEPLSKLIRLDNFLTSFPSVPFAFTRVCVLSIATKLSTNLGNVVVVKRPALSQSETTR